MNGFWCRLTLLWFGCLKQVPNTSYKFPITLGERENMFSKRIHAGLSLCPIFFFCRQTKVPTLQYRWVCDEYLKWANQQDKQKRNVIRLKWSYMLRTVKTVNSTTFSLRFFNPISKLKICFIRFIQNEWLKEQAHKAIMLHISKSCNVCII